MYGIVVLSGPSGVGKSKIIQTLRQHNPHLAFSVSATDRLPRPGEVDGEDYYFMSAQQFDAESQCGNFLETTQREHRYGTLKSELRKGENSLMLLDLDQAGAMAVKQLYPDSCLIFICPPSIEELERRLRGREDNTISEQEILSRLARATAEIEAAALISDHVIVNYSVGKTASEILNIISIQEEATNEYNC